MTKLTGFGDEIDDKTKTENEKSAQLDSVNIHKATGFDNESDLKKELTKEGTNTNKKSVIVERHKQVQSLSQPSKDNDSEEDDSENMLKLATLSVRESQKIKNEYKDGSVNKTRQLESGKGVTESGKREEKKYSEEESQKIDDDIRSQEGDVNDEQKSQEGGVNVEKKSLIDSIVNREKSDKFIETKQKFMSALKEYNEHPVRFTANVIGSNVTRSLRRHGLKKIRKKGLTVISGDFEFVKCDNALLLWKYSGSSINIKIPATIGNLPVITINPDAFTNRLAGGGPLMSSFTRSVFSVFKGSTLENVNSFNLANIVSGVESMELPNTLTTIYEGTFSWCGSIDEIVIPQSVISCPNTAFNMCKVKKLIFNGKVPKNFDPDKFDGEVWCKNDE